MQAVEAPPVARTTPVVNLALRGLLLALTAAFIALIAWNLRDKSVHEGDRAPSFSITSDQGRSITPDNFGGKVLVLNFWATWCPPCITETPSLSALQRKYRDRGLVVLGVSIDKNEEKYKRFIKRFGLPFDTSRDADATLAARYGTFQYPETYIIKDGRVTRKYISDQNWLSDDIDHYLESLLQ